MTPPKVHSDKDAALLEDGLLHNAKALRLTKAIAQQDHLTRMEVRALLAGVIAEMAQTQECLREMQHIREANNPRRKKRGEASEE